MKILEYLNEKFSNSQEGLEEHFSEMGVNVRHEGDLWQFKYDMIDVKWNDVTKECRGHILTIENGKWKFVCHPFDKFFNYSEGHCKIFNRLPKNMRMLSKEDGSCICLYWYNGWKVSTLGTISTMPLNGMTITFEDLFWKTVDKSLCNNLDKNYTHIFELCCEENKIVTTYPFNRVYLLGIRHNDSDNYLSENDVETVAQKLNVMVPKKFSMDFNSVEELNAWVEQKTGEQDGIEHKEGFVVYMDNVPVAKLKSASYVLLHKVATNLSHNDVLEAMFTDKWDDIEKYAPLYLQTFSNKVKIAYRNNINYLAEKLPMFDKTFETQKDLAMFIQKNIDRKVFHAYFYKNKGNWNIDTASKWVKDNWKNFEDDYKLLLNG